MRSWTSFQKLQPPPMVEVEVLDSGKTMHCMFLGMEEGKAKVLHLSGILFLNPNRSAWR